MTTPNHPHHHKIKQLDHLANWMDSKFTIPGTNIQYGLDALIGLIPGIGDTITLAVTAYLIGMARHFNVPWYIKARMIWNAIIDWFIGLIPVIGDLFDIGWKANKRNVALLKDHIDKTTLSNGG